MEHLSNDHKHHPDQHENGHKLWDKTGRPILSLTESQWKQTTTRSKFANGWKAIVEQIVVSEELNKSKRAGPWEWVRDPGKTVNHLSQVIWDRKIIKKFAGPSVEPELVSQSLWWLLKSPETNTLADGLIERTSSVLDKIGSKTTHKGEEGDW